MFRFRLLLIFLSPDDRFCNCRMLNISISSLNPGGCQQHVKSLCWLVWRLCQLTDCIFAKLLQPQILLQFEQIQLQILSNALNMWDGAVTYIHANGTYQRFKGTVVALCNACSVFRLRQMEHINTFRAVICNGETVKIQKNVQIALGILYSMKKRDKWLRQVRELILDFVPQIYLFAKEKNKEEGKGNK